MKNIVFCKTSPTHIDCGVVLAKKNLILRSSAMPNTWKKRLTVAEGDILGPVFVVERAYAPGAELNLRKKKRNLDVFVCQI
jgi:hypothetical protein